MAATAPAGSAPSPAVAPPPGNPRFALFDGLRGTAVLAVVVFHVFLVSGALRRPVVGDAATVLGSAGPILFFAISGFLLYRPWVAARDAGRPAPSTTRYARRRALRIVPAYWVALTALAVYPGLSGVFSGEWWRFYGFLQVYWADTLSRGIPVAWTLCVEVSFYLVLPLWALAAGRATPRRELWALGLVALGGIGVQLAASRLALSHVAATTLLGQCPWMALGMALAVTSVHHHRGPRAMAARPAACWCAAAAAFAGLVALRHDSGGLLGLIDALRRPQPVARTLAEIALIGVMTAMLLLPAVFGERAGGVPRRVLAARPVAWLGLVSYGVYLWHLTIAELLALPAVPAHFAARGADLAGRIPQGATPELLVLTLALSCAVAAVSHRFGELPFLRRTER